MSEPEIKPEKKPEDKPIEKLKGSCHCGQVKFQVDGEKKFQFICYCTDCGAINGGGHLAGIVFDRASLEVEGKVNTYSYEGGSGKPLHLHFCENCATHLYAFSDTHTEVVMVRVNTLVASREEKDFFKPRKALFPDETFHWDVPFNANS